MNSIVVYSFDNDNDNDNDKGAEIYYYYRQQSACQGILNYHCSSVFFNKYLNKITLKLAGNIWHKNQFYFPSREAVMRPFTHSSVSLLNRHELQPGFIGAGNRASEINRLNHLSASPVMSAMSTNRSSSNNVMQILIRLLLS